MNRIDVKELDLPELQIYASSSETQLLHYHEPDLGIFIAESLRVIGRALDAGYEPLSLLLEPGNLEATEGNVPERCGEVPVYVASADALSKLAGYKLTGGALCAMRRKALRSPAEICAGAGRIAVMEGITNPTNVGAIFRSAAALGVEAVLMTPDCSDPLYRRAARVSMGTVFQIPWGFFARRKKEQQLKAGREMKQPADVALLKEMGYTTVAMALTDRSVSIADERLHHAEKLAIILGNENNGLTEQTIEACDYTVRIPMQNGVDSLNVAAASAVAFWELCGKR
ncbi:MAG: RNA methyltransferase [Lachnospiraceae bacterium]|nr:RNA methyltransferase [Lachnospiraceae bacterium]